MFPFKHAHFALTIRGMEWWQTLIVAAVPAVVTAAALLYQTHQNNDREDKRRTAEAEERDKDRKHQLQIAASERQHVVTDAWRDDRKNAHAEAFAALDDDHRQFVVGLVVPMRITPEMLKAQARSRAGVSVVKLYGSQAAASLAAQAHTKLAQIQAEMGLFGVRTDGLAGKLSDASNEIEMYVAAARRELETNS